MGWVATILRKLRNKVASKFIHPDSTFFDAIKYNNSIECSWSLDKDTIDYLDEHYDSKITLRAFDGQAAVAFSKL